MTGHSPATARRSAVLAPGRVRTPRSASAGLQPMFWLSGSVTAHGDVRTSTGSGPRLRDELHHSRGRDHCQDVASEVVHGNSLGQPDVTRLPDTFGGGMRWLTLIALVMLTGCSQLQQSANDEAARVADSVLPEALDDGISHADPAAPEDRKVAAEDWLSEPRPPLMRSRVGATWWVRGSKGTAIRVDVYQLPGIGALLPARSGESHLGCGLPDLRRRGRGSNEHSRVPRRNTEGTLRGSAQDPPRMPLPDGGGARTTCATSAAAVTGASARSHR